MKSATAKFTVLVIALSIGCMVNAQNYKQNGAPKTGTFVPHAPSKGNGPKQDNYDNLSAGQSQWAISNAGWGQNYPSYGNISLGFSSASYNQYPYQGYNYGSVYSLKKSAKYAIRSAGFVINDAVGFHNWHEVYSPLLAKAIRHFNYSRHLYKFANYEAALNHAERARYLAWYSLQYYQSPVYGQNEFFQTDPYSDPYNPYYKKPNMNGSQSGEHEDEVYKNEQFKTNSIDSNLPENELDDKSTIRSFDKSAIKVE